MFSIILPNYNHARFLHKRIQSILNQTFRDYEIIILDDKSTDNSIEIINSYNDERIKHKAFNIVNSGSPFKQWKKGLEIAKFDYVWIAESDDFAEPTFLETAYENIVGNTGISLFYCDSNLVGENEEPYSNNIQKFCSDLDKELWNNDHHINGELYFRKYLIKKCFILNASSVVFKKEAGLKYINKVIEYKASGDWLFWSLLLKEGSVYFSSKKLNYFRHSLQSTRNYNTLEKRERRIIEKMKIKKVFSENYNFSPEEIMNEKEDLVNEWIKYHSIKESFSRGYYKICEFDFLNTSKTKLFFLLIRNKITSRFFK